LAQLHRSPFRQNPATLFGKIFQMITGSTSGLTAACVRFENTAVINIGEAGAVKTFLGYDEFNKCNQSVYAGPAEEDLKNSLHILAKHLSAGLERHIAGDQVPVIRHLAIFGCFLHLHSATDRQLAGRKDVDVGLSPSHGIFTAAGFFSSDAFAAMSDRKTSARKMHARRRGMLGDARRRFALMVRL
jgi:hypothetical protein